MKVRDLVEQLAGFDPELPVVVGLSSPLYRVDLVNVGGLPALELMDAKTASQLGLTAKGEQRRAPVQEEESPRDRVRKPPGTIAWSEHVQAWRAYAHQYGEQQSAERMAQRGGFGYYELVIFLGHEPKTWLPR